MVGTRSSARVVAAGNGNSSGPNTSRKKPSPGAGNKRKADTAPATTSKSKRGKKGDDKEQITIEASMPSDETKDESKDVEMKDEVEAKPAEVSNGEIQADAVAEDNAGMKNEIENVKPEEKGEKDEASKGEEKKDKVPTQKMEIQSKGNADGDGKKEPEKNGLETIMNNASGVGKVDDKNVTEEGTGSRVSKADNAVEGTSSRNCSSVLVLYLVLRDMG